MRAAAEVFLSYLSGLGPVGQPVEPRLDWLMADLGYNQKVSIYRCLNDLLGERCVERLAGGRNGTIGLLVVRRRLEHMPDRRQPPRPALPSQQAAAVRAHMAEWRVSKEERAARLAEIPPDNRTLTQRYFGDPVHERSALYRRQRDGQAAMPR